MIEHAQDAIYSFALFGMTQQTVVDMKAVGTMVIVGAISAFGASFLTARDTASELKQYAKSQEEFRVEMRMFMRESSTESRTLADRLTRQEVLMFSLHPPGGGLSPQHGGMGGMNGMGERANGNGKK